MPTEFGDPTPQDQQVAQGGKTQFGDPVVTKPPVAPTPTPAAVPQSHWYDKDNLIEFMRPFVGDAAMAGGTALAAPTGPFAPAIGLGAAGLADRLMQHAESQPPRGIISQATGQEPGSFGSDLTNTGEMLLGNKLAGYAMGKVARPIANAVEGFKGNIVDPGLAKLQATASQYLDPNTFMGRAAKFVEDTFAAGSKKNASANSAAIAFDQTKQKAANLAGRNLTTVSNPEVHGQLIQQEALANQDNLKQAFNKFATEQQYYKPQHDPITGAQTNPNFDPMKYSDATQNATAVATLHDSLFDQKGLSGLVNDPNNTAVPFIDKILADPQKLQRALKTSALPIPGTKSITSDALRGDLRSYYLNSIIDKAATRNPSSGAINNLDMQKVQDLFNDPSMTESMKLLFNSQTRSDLNQLFKNIAKTQVKQGYGFSSNAKLYHTVSGIEAASSLLSGHISWGLPVAAIQFGGHLLGKAMTQPGIARSLVAAASGQPMNLSQQTVARELAKALNGAIMNVITSDDKQVRGKLTDGQFEPTAQQP